MKDSALVAVIIVTWNNAKDISECLSSLSKQTYKNYKIIVIDNNSQDNTTEIIEKNFADINLIKLKRNLYYAGGNNYGFEYADKNYSPDFFLVLNPDTIVESNLLEVLVDEITKDKEIVAIGPKIIFRGGDMDGRINSASLFYDGFHSAYDLGFGEKDKGQFDETKPVFGVTGTCILFRKNFIIEEKGFWSILKMYIEEVELFIRAQKQGYKVVYTGKTSVQHKYMQSSIQKKDWDIEQHKMRNWVLIALRHYSWRDKLRMIRDYIKFIY